MHPRACHQAILTSATNQCPRPEKVAPAPPIPETAPPAADNRKFPPAESPETAHPPPAPTAHRPRCLPATAHSPDRASPESSAAHPGKASSAHHPSLSLCESAVCPPNAQTST